jgi:hypothetical protein
MQFLADEARRAGYEEFRPGDGILVFARRGTDTLEP